MNFEFILSYIYWLTIAAIAIVSFIQNMVFTAVSRSRNSGDPKYHRRCAYFSNGIWFVCQFFIWSRIWKAFDNGNLIELIPVAIVYVLATAEGSVVMMKILLKKETGKRRVGARHE